MHRRFAMCGHLICNEEGTGSIPVRSTMFLTVAESLRRSYSYDFACSWLRCRAQAWVMDAMVCPKERQQFATQMPGGRTRSSQSPVLQSSKTEQRLYTRPWHC